MNRILIPVRNLIPLLLLTVVTACGTTAGSNAGSQSGRGTAPAAAASTIPVTKSVAVPADPSCHFFTVAEMSAILGGRHVDGYQVNHVNTDETDCMFGSDFVTKYQKYRYLGSVGPQCGNQTEEGWSGSMITLPDFVLVPGSSPDHIYAGAAVAGGQIGLLYLARLPDGCVLGAVGGLDMTNGHPLPGTRAALLTAMKDALSRAS